MFTGIVQAVGAVANQTAGSITVSAPFEFAPSGFEEGESIAVSGCCLTVVSARRTGEGWDLDFDVSPETYARTSFQCLRDGSQLNLERAMAADGRFGGHIVQGHVDATGSLARVTPAENSWIYRFEAPPEYDRYLIDKGSIAVEGISLTVVEPEGGAFDVWVIPHTLRETNLGSKRIGDTVNLEFDVIAKHVEKLLAGATKSL